MLALFGAMAILAAVPSVSVLAVTSRAASAGFLHGAVTAAGVVVGDVLFILLAIFGLSFLAEATGGHFAWIQLTGAVYLLWLGLRLCRSDGSRSSPTTLTSSSLLSSFMTGLLITLGDQKAVLFYLGFLPAFVDLSTVSSLETAIVIAVTFCAVGGIKLIYAYLAHRAGSFLGAGTGRTLNIVAGIVMIAASIWLFFKAVASLI